ncbi:GNAT family N-acetyltransferase [Brachybacterium sp. SGAir0954]|uniref:GNAT family N-acetyltransferase n=1 Tax=Brachybacterium sp. SGAir0954 TaxID=2571029 RepID=UPI0010CCC546|nr:N-acetyltransferase [Brachybacterium sp. SGAir0954]QCR52475.1 GNAT family N-acetyltransferase [Brachybacterium sp. SGAir0954]
MSSWTTRPEDPADPREAAAIREVLLAAFPTAEEADLVDALRADDAAWIPELSLVATGEDGAVLAQALLTRCTVGGEPALALAPCAVVPAHQRQGAGSAAIRAALAAATRRAEQGGENLVVVLGHAEYYPRFGFTPAADAGVLAPFDVPPEAFMSLALAPARPVPQGLVGYPTAFGI